MNDSTHKAWLVSADMGYGHQRAIYPLKDLADEEIITVGSGGRISQSERKLWRNLLGVYEFFSRAKGIPLIGPSLFSLLDSMLKIPSIYPMRNLSSTTFQVNLL